MKKHLKHAWKSTYGPSIICLVLFALASAAIIKLHEPKNGTPALPQAALADLRDYSGNSVDFESFTGRPLIVYFWASWCPYCQSELQYLAQVKAREGNNITILAVNRGEPLATAKSYTDPLNLSGITYLLDPNDSLFKKLDGYAMPEGVYIDRIGNVVAHQHGPVEPSDIDAAVAQITQ